MQENAVTIIDHLRKQQLNINESMCLAMLCYTIFTEGSRANVLTIKQSKQHLRKFFYEWEIEKAFSVLKKTVN